MQVHPRMSLVTTCIVIEGLAKDSILHVGRLPHQNAPRKANRGDDMVCAGGLTPIFPFV
jgi:hypothetical protein